MSEQYELDFDRIVQILNEQGIKAYTEQTGGGTATIYAGTPVHEEGWGDRYPAVAGPGYFAGPGWTHGTGTKGEFCVGPDDDGVANPIFSDDTWTEQRAADEIAKVVLTGRIQR